MLPKKITSLQHPLVKYLVELRKERSQREKTREVLISGEKLIRELAQKTPLTVLLTLEESDQKIAAHDRYIVSEEVLKKVTGVENPDGYAATIPMPSSATWERKERLLILDGLQDPGNLGTLFRTALALQWDGIWLTPGTVDPFNDKALRAAQGATFWIPFSWKTGEEIRAWMEKSSCTLYIADIEGEPLDAIRSTSPLALILSSESHGPKEWPAQKITIPMSPQVESLNVAISGAILLYNLRK